MKLAPTPKTLGLAAALLVLIAGFGGLSLSGCGGGNNEGAVSMTARPLLDQEAPGKFQTATFAFG